MSKPLPGLMAWFSPTMARSSSSGSTGNGIGKVVLETPGGVTESGETPKTTAERELLEETGFAAQRVRLVGRMADANSVDFYDAAGTLAKLVRISPSLP